MGVFFASSKRAKTKNLAAGQFEFPFPTRRDHRRRYRGVGEIQNFRVCPLPPSREAPDNSRLAFALCMLGKKQEEKLQPFHHEHVKSLRFRWVQNPNGGALLQALIIVPNVPTDPSDPNFEKTKIDALVDAAIKHLNGQKCTCLLEIEA